VYHVPAHEKRCDDDAPVKAAAKKEENKAKRGEWLDTAKEVGMWATVIGGIIFTGKQVLDELNK